MEQSKAQKEELLSLLTEIYDQLEELERAIDTNLNKERNEMFKEQSDKLSRCEVQMNELEYNLNKVVPFPVEKPKVKLAQNPNLKFELGY